MGKMKQKSLDMDRYIEVEDGTQPASSLSSSASSCYTACTTAYTSLTTEASHLDAGWTPAKDADGAQTLGCGQIESLFFHLFLSLSRSFSCGTICNSGCSWHILSSFLVLIYTHRCFRIYNMNAHFRHNIRHNI